MWRAMAELRVRCGFLRHFDGGVGVCVWPLITASAANGPLSGRVWAAHLPRRNYGVRDPSPRRRAFASLGLE